VGSDGGDDGVPGRLTPVDTTTFTTGASIDLPHMPGHMRAVGDVLWLVYQYDSALGRVDTSTGEATEIELPESGFDVLPVGEEIWVTLWNGNDLARIDAATGELLGLIDGVTGPGRLIEAFGSVWVSNTGADPGTISRIDPVTRRAVQAPIEVGTQPLAMAADDDRLYVALFGGGSVAVLAPQP
jgi:streptogramin lyase